MKNSNLFPLSRIRYCTSILAMVLFLFPTISFSKVNQGSKKLRTRMRLEFFNNPDNTKTIQVAVFAVENRVQVPVVNEKVFFYLGEISENILVDSIITSAEGIARLDFPSEHQFPKDENRMVSFSVHFPGNKAFTEKSSDIDFRDISMELFLSEINEQKNVIIRAYEIGTDKEMIPVEDAKVSLYVPRLFSNQLIGSGRIEEGKCEIEYPEKIVGDTIGNISIIASIEEDDLYGNVERRITNFRWGTTSPIEEDKSLMSIEITIPTRALWHTNAPLWMIITLIILLAGVWGHYLYVVFQLFILYQSGKKRRQITAEKG